MNKNTMIKIYRKYSVADSYIIGFNYKHNIYMLKVNEIMPRFLQVGIASRNKGENLRFRLNNAKKEQLIRKGAKIICKDEMLLDDKYNKGEIFEKIVTEIYGQIWEKDSVPFWKDGDITVDGEKIQIKFQDATLLNTNQISKLREISLS